MISERVKDLQVLEQVYLGWTACFRRVWSVKSDIGYSGIRYTIFLFKFPILSMKKEIVSFYTICRPFTNIHAIFHRADLQFEISFVHWRVVLLLRVQQIPKRFFGLIHIQSRNNFPVIDMSAGWREQAENIILTGRRPGLPGQECSR